MHLFNSPVSLMTQTNWHEPCHLGTHCPSDENGCGTALEAPRPLYLRAEKIKRDTWIPESDRIFASAKNHRWYHPSTFLTSHERPWELVLNRPTWPQLPLAFCLSLSLVPTFGGNEQANINSPYSCFWYTWDPSDWKHIPSFIQWYPMTIRNMRFQMQSQQPSGAFWTAAALSFSEASEVASIEEPSAEKNVIARYHLTANYSFVTPPKISRTRSQN